MLLRIEYGVSLDKLIIKSKLKFHKVIVKFVTAQILLILEYLHRNKVLYRDLKASNIVLNRIGQVKLLDFGLAVKLDEKKKKRKSFCGTLHCMAPEFFLSQPYSFEVDYFALGILSYELTY